ncbi:MAG: BT_3928 family protein [Chitinophagaceae bacterium]
MKVLTTICRWLVGLLFIFSGLIKANDPLGLSFKMQEFFEKWGMEFLNNYSYSFAFAINIVEVLAGVAIIIAWRPKLFTWLLLLLILFFTFLTSYVLFSGKIHACGCFGDCVPLTPIQTFTKDIILLILILVILFNLKNVQPLFNSKISISILVFTVAATGGIELYVAKHLPFMDCLPYKKGNNILDQMKPPVGSVSDSILITTRYKKAGKEVEIIGDNFPSDFDSTYEFIEGSQVQKIIRKGNNTPKIANFSLTTFGNVDTTQAVLNSEKKYVMIFIKEFKSASEISDLINISALQDIQKKGLPVFVVTSDVEGAANIIMKDVIFLKCDATELKTAARVNPTYFLMQGATILNKLAATDANKLLN